MGANSRLRTLNTITIEFPPHPDLHRLILPRSIPKHGWRWVRAESGEFWGASGPDVLQVQDNPPNYPARPWKKVKGEWVADDWQPVKELL